MRSIFDAAPLRKSEILVICQSAQFVNPLNSQRAVNVIVTGDDDLRADDELRVAMANYGIQLWGVHSLLQALENA